MVEGGGWVGVAGEKTEIAKDEQGRHFLFLPAATKRSEQLPVSLPKLQSVWKKKLHFALDTPVLYRLYFFIPIAADTHNNGSNVAKIDFVVQK